LVVLITFNGKRIAFLIDEVLNEQEVLIKSLGRQLSRVRNVAGATVLATRKLAPVLNVSDLMKSAIKVGNAALRAAPLLLEEETPKKTSVLVVEDSITARTLLRSILEASGYDVKTAVDGVDGFTQLRSGEFDIVISDVEMPRMNGFDLAAKIRGDKKFAELPVVLVTALESREDRERGIDVGANAYIVKSSFDQSNLLEVIQRLA
jgi:two-component system chemotaxis sensor kinase CheA